MKRINKKKCNQSKESSIGGSAIGLTNKSKERMNQTEESDRGRSNRTDEEATK